MHDAAEGEYPEGLSRLKWVLPIGDPIENRLTLNCGLGDMIRQNQRPGAKWAIGCSGTANAFADTKFVANGEHTYVGVEQLLVEGVSVPTHHVKEVRNLSGDNVQGFTYSGSDAMEWWFDDATGIPVKSLRKTSAQIRNTASVPALINSQDYNLDWGFELASFQPQAIKDAGAIEEFDCPK